MSDEAICILALFGLIAIGIICATFVEIFGMKK